PALPGRDVVVDAAVNRTTGQGVDVSAALGADWDVVVILLGHNDGGSPGVYQPAARRLLDRLALVPRVVWLTLHEVRPYYRDVNAFLGAEANRRPNLRIADWNGLVGANPGSTASDGLHLTSRGAGLMAGLVADQVTTAERDFAPPPPPPPTTTASTLPPATVPPTVAPTVASSAASAPPSGAGQVPRTTKRLAVNTAPLTAPTKAKRLAVNNKPSHKPRERYLTAMALTTVAGVWVFGQALRRRRAPGSAASRAPQRTNDQPD
ncbi:MAG: hypothetical protein ABIP03_13665, partial [Aquihabitans sp.]